MRPVLDQGGWKWCTCFEGLDREGCLSQEVGVAEHVFLKDHKAQEGKLGVVDIKDKLLHEPDGVEAVVGFGGGEKGKKAAH